ncbi:MAG: polysaccharide deacetylase family protein [Bifidobacteriaceae bacterium]|jgi:uncharacterized repeat protein (TIGR02543 family)|nr:polysaccharide deacetylase family protein [Bifidobacteriaceae bacterium]
MKEHKLPIIIATIFTIIILILILVFATKKQIEIETIDLGLTESQIKNHCHIQYFSDDKKLDEYEMLDGYLFKDQEIVPIKDNFVFNGWYIDSNAERVNYSTELNCEKNNDTIKLNAKWITTNEWNNIKPSVSIPILMYHYFYDPNNPTGEMNSNVLSSADFDAEMKYLSENSFYYPSWLEINDFLDGKITLPIKSVIVTDDDNTATWFNIGLPIVEKYKVMATQFTITGTEWWDGHSYDNLPASLSKYVIMRSHTNAMHGPNRGEFVGYMKGGDPNLIANDLIESAKRLGGKKEVLCYPAGEYSDSTLDGLRMAGYNLGVTTKPGTVKFDSIKLELPRIRISSGQDLTSFMGIFN